MGACASLQVLEVDGDPAGQLPLQAAQEQYSLLAQDFKRIPSYCFTGNTVNELQSKQCVQRWWAIVVHSFWILFPFLFTAGVLYWGVDVVRSVYRLANKRLQSGKKAYLAITTDPPSVPNDLYAWFHHCQTITVALPNQEQVRVYIPYNLNIPQAGQQVAVVDIGSRFGTLRRMGVVYTPHVLVVRGE